MKYYIYIITALLPIFLLVACVQEDITGNNQNSDMITLNVAVSGTSAATRAAALEEKESNISNLYILFYKEGGGDDATPDYFCSATGIEGLAWTKSFLLSSTNLKKGESYNGYTLANLPSTVTPPTEKTTKGDLLAMTESIATDLVRKLDGSDISFSSYKDTTFSISDTTANEYKINLTRTVARLDMCIDTTGISADWEITSVNLINEQLSTNYFQTNTTRITNNAVRIGQANRLLNEDGKSQWRYYLYEASKDSEPKVSLKINLKSKTSTSTRSYTAIVNKIGGGEIARNYIYKSTILLTDAPPEPVVIEATPVAWSDTIGVNISVPSVYLDFPTDNILLSNRGAAVYNFKSDADSVYIKMNMPNLVIQSILGKTEGYILPKVAGIYELNMAMSGYTTSLENGQITFKAGNLTKVMPVEKPASSASFIYTISPCDSWIPGDIKIYNSQTEGDAKFNIKFDGVVGQQAWFGFALISQTDRDGNIMNFTEPSRKMLTELHIFPSGTTMVFNVMDVVGSLKPWQGYTFTYKMICGAADQELGPILKEFIFCIKVD